MTTNTGATLVFTVKNSKGYLHRKIDQKQEQIRRIEHNEALKYGPNGRYPRVITRDDERKERLQSEINELERIEKNPGCSAVLISRELDIPLRTTQRELAGLSDDIEHIGSSKTGGYYLK